jgi:hypothetical protein
MDVPPKLIISITWKVLCVDLIGTYTLKDNDVQVLMSCASLSLIQQLVGLR